jgi:hypothetical protein
MVCGNEIGSQGNTEPAALDLGDAHPLLRVWLQFNRDRVRHRFSRSTTIALCPSYLICSNDSNFLTCPPLSGLLLVTGIIIYLRTAHSPDGKLASDGGSCGLSDRAV